MSSVSLTKCDCCGVQEPYDPSAEGRPSGWWNLSAFSYVKAMDDGVVGKRQFSRQGDFCPRCSEKHIFPLLRAAFHEIVSD